MSVGRHWLVQLARSFFGPASRSQRVAFRQRSVEALEERKYLSATMTLFNNGQTLSIVGDRSDDHILITQDSSGVHVTADSSPTRDFTGIDMIQVETVDGNDDVRVIYGFNPQPDPPGMPFRAANLYVRLGNGNDTFNFDGQLPHGAFLVGVDAGAGNDDVRVNCSFNPQPEPPGSPVRPLDLYVRLGAGNDRFSLNFAGATDSRDLPDPCRVAVMGEGGADSINALIGLLSNAMPAGAVQGPLDMTLDGGEGNDVVTSTLRSVNLNGRTSINLQGGNGNDNVRQVLDMVTVNATLDLNVVGGMGNDVLMLLNAAEPRTDVALPPSLYVNSHVRLNVQGDAGNDRLLGLIQSCIMPAGSLDMIFSGGGGNDVITLLLGLESGMSDPPPELGATGEVAPPSDRGGPVSLTVLGGEGNDQLNLTIRNLDNSESPLTLRLEGGPGRDTANVSAGIDASGWTI